MAGVAADTVDARLGPQASFLAPDSNAVAQALLSNPELRGQTAFELSHTLSVSVDAARVAIGSIIGMIDRVALGDATSPLRAEPTRTGAIGAGMSLDVAMSRFGSHMGPIVVTPSPLWSPDAGPGRQTGAGALSEAGAVASLDVAAAALIAFYGANDCSVSPNGVVRQFQESYNAAYLGGHISVDDLYGPQTHDALTKAVADMAPVSTFGDAPPPCVAATPASHPAAPQVQGSGMLLLGLAAGAAALYLLAKKKRHVHVLKWARL
jgi:hypothetical protein